ncbi:MAG: hypothetical protein ACE14L_13460 [Terriglobales bacterium]
MSGAAHNLDQEFWRPPEQASSAPAISAETCARCNTEFVVGARFCHVCGTEREPQPSFTDDGLSHHLDIRIIRDALHLTTPALIAFIAGLGCLIAAVITGFMYTATTLLDWQAVQLWRIQWLLAAIVTFAAGVLLNRQS